MRSVGRKNTHIIVFWFWKISRTLELMVTLSDGLRFILLPVMHPHKMSICRPSATQCFSKSNKKPLRSDSLPAAIFRCSQVKFFRIYLQSSSASALVKTSFSVRVFSNNSRWNYGWKKTTFRLLFGHSRVQWLGWKWIYRYILIKREIME